MKTRDRMTSLVCSMLVATALTAQAGIVMKQVVKGDGKGRAAQMQDVESTISVEGKGMRLDYVESKNPAMKKGDYMVSNDGGQTFYMVQPKEKSYMKFDLAMAGGMMSMTHAKVSDVKSELVSDESGPRMLGYPTRHIKTTMSYTMEMSIFGMHQKNQTAQEREMWTTTKIDASPFEAYAKNFAGKAGNKELDELAEASMKNFRGVPLKTVMVIANIDKNGKKTTNTMTTEVTEVREQSLPKSLFEVPSDYKNAMEGMMSRRGGDKDSDESESGSEDAPKQRKTPSLSDMMKMFRK
jgi:hypothetical protein